MADLFAIQGSYSATPGSGSPSADPIITAPLDEKLMLSTEVASQVTLTSDTPVSLSLGGLSAVNALVIKALGGKIRVQLTSEDGVLQSIPVDSFLALTSISTNITNVTVTRSPAVTTVVKYFLGQKT